MRAPAVHPGPSTPEQCRRSLARGCRPTGSQAMVRRLHHQQGQALDQPLTEVLGPLAGLCELLEADSPGLEVESLLGDLSTCGRSHGRPGPGSALKPSWR